MLSWQLLGVGPTRREHKQMMDTQLKQTIDSAVEEDSAEKTYNFPMDAKFGR